MIFIDGIAFSSGSGSIPGLQTLAHFGDVAVATINYRLGALGFLSTESMHSPGNYGLWDLLTAIRWLKTNAVVFGVDPSRITLIGSSSGAACATQLAFSAHSAGLIDRVIAQSGSAFAPWALDKRAMEKTRHLASYFGCLYQEIPKMMKCLHQMNSSLIIESPMLHSETDYQFGPVLDWDFFSAPPDVLLEDPRLQQMEFMGGAISTEGYSLATKAMKAGTLDDAFMDSIKRFLQTQYLNVEAAYTAIEINYFRNATSPLSLLGSASHFFHDGMYAAGQEKIAQVLARSV